MSHRALTVCGVLLLISIVSIGLAVHLHQSTRPQPVIHGSLVSLGDSVAAGDGLPESSSSQANTCHQSIEAYPYLIAQSLSMRLRQFACSGAQTSAGILQAQIVGSQTVPAQLQAATPYISGNDVVVTIGANDVGWNNFLLSCAESNCLTSANLASFQAKLATLQDQLNIMLQDVAALHPHLVLLNTYYSIIANSDTCMQQYGITAPKIQWVNDREASLNAALISAAQKYHDRYATITFSGHGICSTDPWIQGLSSSAPLHPSAAGQYNISTIDEAQLR